MIDNNVIPVLRPLPENDASAEPESGPSPGPEKGLTLWPDNGLGLQRENGSSLQPVSPSVEGADPKELLAQVDGIKDILDVAAQSLLRGCDAHPERIGTALRMAVEELDRLRDGIEIWGTSGHPRG